MLRRIFCRTNFRITNRCLSDKPTNDDSKPPEIKAAKQPDGEKVDQSSTDKIQQILKQMMEVKEKEIEERDYGFLTERPKFRKPKGDEIEVKMEQIEENITKAAADVAQAIGGDTKQTEAELLSRVLGKINQTSTSLSDLILGMKVDNTQSADNQTQPETRGQQVKRLVQRSKQEVQTRYGERKERARSIRSTEQQQSMTVNIFGDERLGIFQKRGDVNYGTKSPTWEELQQRELQLATAQPPANYFQKMVLWTKQGKVWKFPLDNEQGLEEEQEVHFSEHVFLDSHLEDWCPKRGPIRQFMELVCVGLSKNPFYTALEKKDTLHWYKEYFEEKKDLLKEVGAWDVPASPSKEVLDVPSKEHPSV